jgi:hypothetical protein
MEAHLWEHIVHRPRPTLNELAPPRPFVATVIEAFGQPGGGMTWPMGTIAKSAAESKLVSEAHSKSNLMANIGIALHCKYVYGHCIS